MARYNKVIELLEQGKPVFCSGLVWNGNLDDLAFVADSEYDMTIIEMEHRISASTSSECRCNSYFPAKRLQTAAPSRQIRRRS